MQLEFLQYFFLGFFATPWIMLDVIEEKITEIVLATNFILFSISTIIMMIVLSKYGEVLDDTPSELFEKVQKYKLNYQNEIEMYYNLKNNLKSNNYSLNRKNKITSGYIEIYEKPKVDGRLQFVAYIRVNEYKKIVEEETNKVVEEYLNSIYGNEKSKDEITILKIVVVDKISGKLQKEIARSIMESGYLGILTIGITLSNSILNMSDRDLTYSMYNESLYNDFDINDFEEEVFKLIDCTKIMKEEKRKKHK